MEMISDRGSTPLASTKKDLPPKGRFFLLSVPEDTLYFDLTAHNRLEGLTVFKTDADPHERGWLVWKPDKND